MRCKAVRKKLLWLVDHPESAAGKLALHLQECPTCQRELALLRRIRSTLQAAAAPPAPPAFAAGVMARITAEQKERTSRWASLLINWKRLAAAGAALLLVAGSALALVRSEISKPAQLASKEQRPVLTQHKVPAPAQPSQAEHPGRQTVPGQEILPPAAPQPKLPTTAPTKPVKEAIKPRANEPTPPQVKPPKAVAVAPPVRVFLNRQRVIESTILRMAVADLAPAKARAKALAAAYGATELYTTRTRDQEREIEIYQFIVAKDQSGAFIRGLTELGAVVYRQEERKDVTEEFNSLKTEYERLVAQYKVAPQTEQVALAATLSSLEERLSQLEAAANQYTVTLCLVEQKDNR